MSTMAEKRAETRLRSEAELPRMSELPEEMVQYLKPLASLKLSVVLFALGIFLVLAGTLAQVEKDIWEVVSGYFRCWVAWIDLQIFFPKTWVPEFQNVPGGFWFPGGWMIGTLMSLNLLAAHAIRFKVQAKGQRFLWGIAITLIGVALTWAVVQFGTARDTIYETASFDATTYWNLLCYGLLIPAVGCGIAASKQSSSEQKVEFWTYTILCLAFLGTSLFLIAGGEAVRLNNSAMRILWQLIQATFAGGVLLGGCLLLFKKRAGIVLLHAGVLLLMANEIVVHQLHDEANIILSEGETTNFVQDIRTSELVFIDHSDAEADVQTVVPAPLLIQAGEAKETLKNEQLPFDVVVREFYPNADLKPRAEGDENPATAGLGKSHTIVPQRKSSGTESAADYPAAYIDLLDKETGKPVETLVVSALAASIDQTDTVKAGGKEYEVALRFKRNYKPYSVHLIDVRKDDYIGTTTPMNYSSEIRLVDKSRNEDRQIKIWMNNPLRFAGETFYQSGYQEVGGKEVTTLQVVTNEGWMIPYVACMIVAIGMLYQFGLTLMRFLNRVAAGRVPVAEGTASENSAAEPREWNTWGTSLIPAVILVAVCGAWLYKQASVPAVTDKQMNLYAVGQIPVVYEGRVKPLDTLARNSLRILSNRETIKLQPEYDTEKTDGKQAEKATSTDKNDSKKDKEPTTLSATQWLMELAAGLPIAMERPVLRIDSEELLSTLKLERRKSHLYSLKEIQPQLTPQIRIENADLVKALQLKPVDSNLYPWPNVQEKMELLSNEQRTQLATEAKEELTPLMKAMSEARALNEKSPESISLYQRKVLELERKLGLIDLLSLSFLSPPIDPSAGNVSEQMKFALSSVKRLDNRKPPLLVPPVKQQTADLEPALQRNEWETYSKAFLLDILYSGGFQVEGNPFSGKFAEIILAFQNDDVAAFNKGVREYQGLLREQKVSGVDPEKLAFETQFNHFAPFFWPAFIYILAFVLAIVSWLFPSYVVTLNRAALGLILLTFIVHTWAIYARIQISGRPPVTNLYSSAVFIGWAAVLFGVVMEFLFKRGIGNVLAATAGFASLWIAHGLAGDGDTFTVLQAVLDTQFWLSTHVVCITLGYAATFVAGLLGMIYITRRNPFALLAVLCAVGAVVALQHNESIPLLVRNIGPYLLAIPAGLIPMYLVYGAPRLALPETMEKNLARMIYGTLCFALWFSFVGTVLGGLWADDSWGRFWGWDPKENGALIIVLWNALVLHARWDRLVKDRGLALLAIAGNITTTWSWFGVNELGVGLHSYGFTEGVLFNLSLFVFSQLALITIGAWGREKQQLPV